MARPRKTEKPASVILRVELSYEDYSRYKEEAERKTVQRLENVEVEEVVSDRLSLCSDHKYERSVYFGGSDLDRLETLLRARPLRSAEDVLQKLQGALTLEFSGQVATTLTPNQIRRLQLGARKGQSWQDYAAYLASREIARVAGV